ncbi:MAG: hypothetical protein ACR2LK_16060 [Solirubrobacteraceae bacterium]
MIPRAALALMIAVIALVAGGCGGEDGDEPDPAEVRRAYVAEVDALCKRVTEQSRPRNRKIQALIEGEGTFSSRLRKGAPLLRQTYKAQRDKLERFKEIEPPEDDREQIEELTTAAEAALEDLRKALPAADRGDLPPIINLVTDATGNLGEVESLGIEYGFAEDCFGLPIELG